MQVDRYNNQVDLVAQSHGLYIRLRDRLGRYAATSPVVRHAYERYQRRLAHLPKPDDLL